MHCSLFIRDFLSSEDVARANRSAAAETLIARGRRKLKAPVALEQWLFERFEVRTRQGCPAAPYTLLADGGVSEKYFWMRADPVHLSVGIDSLRLDEARLDLSRAEAEALAATLNRHFGEALSFLPLSPERWYVRFDEAPELDTTPLSAVRGSSIGSKLPSGPHAARFHSLMNETQMLLHEHPVNTEREARGVPGINSVWFWGGGSLEPPRARPYSVVLAEDPLARGLARSAGIAERSVSRDAGAMLDALPHEGKALVVIDSRNADLDRHWFAPLLAALQDGRIGMLSLALPGKTSLLEVETARSDLRHFWRMRKPLETFFA